MAKYHLRAKGDKRMTSRFRNNSCEYLSHKIKADMLYLSDKTITESFQPMRAKKTKNWNNACIGVDWTGGDTWLESRYGTDSCQILHGKHITGLSDTDYSYDNPAPLAPGSSCLELLPYI